MRKCGLRMDEWRLERGDFSATWNQRKPPGVSFARPQIPTPSTLFCALRIRLLLARTGGFLLHASSAVRNGKAFLFSGLSEAGKTTIARLAPARMWPCLPMRLLTSGALRINTSPTALPLPATWRAREKHLRSNCRGVSARQGAGEQNRECRSSRSHSAPDAEHPLFCARPGIGAHGLRVGLRLRGSRAGLSAFVFPRRARLGPDWVKYADSRKISGQRVPISLRAPWATRPSSCPLWTPRSLC